MCFGASHPLRINFLSNLVLNGLNFAESKPDFSSLKKSMTLVKVRKVLWFTSQLGTSAGSWSVSFCCWQEILQSVDQTIKDNEKQKVRKKQFVCPYNIKLIVN